jgi:hypothetical protein
VREISSKRFQEHRGLAGSSAPRYREHRSALRPEIARVIEELARAAVRRENRHARELPLDDAMTREVEDR